MTWTGKKCPACKGHGERYSAHHDCDAACPDCGGTGEEWKAEDAIVHVERPTWWSCRCSACVLQRQEKDDQYRDNAANGHL